MSTSVDLESDWTIKPICLPNPCLTYDGLNGVVAGWGATSPGNYYSNIILQ